MRQLTVDVPEALFHALQQRAYDEGVSADDVVRSAVTGLLAQHPVQTALERVGVQIVRDVPYLGAARSETLDLYVPPVPHEQLQPAVVLVHGGSWTKGDKSSRRLIELAGRLAQGGIVCASVNYLLATPEKPSWPTCIHDIKQAIQFLRAHAPEYRVDSNRIVVYGGSWGGYLAALVAATGDHALTPTGTGVTPSTRVQGLVVMNPPLDPLRLIGPAKLASLFGGPVDPNEVTPCGHVRAGHPPTLLLRGTADDRLPAEHTVRYIEALAHAGVLYEARAVEDGGHVIDLDIVARSIGDVCSDWLVSRNR